MRTIIVIVSILLLFTISFADENENTSTKLGSKALLFELNGLDNLRADSYNGGIGMKYFLKNNVAIRGGLQFSYSSATKYANPGSNYKGEDGSSSTTVYGIEGAIEYHLTQEKISPFIGGGLSISSQSSDLKNPVTWLESSTSHITRPVRESSSGLDLSFFGLAGAEIFITKTISLSAEYLISYSATGGGESKYSYETVSGSGTLPDSETVKNDSMSSLRIFSAGSLIISIYF